MLASFATVAALAPGHYCRPSLHPLSPEDTDIHKQEPRRISLIQARHPCVELMDGVDFIANDYSLTGRESSFQIVTGPNMGGKSTYIRGLGCLMLLAQVRGKPVMNVFL